MTQRERSTAQARDLMNSCRQVHRAVTQLMRMQAAALDITPDQMMVLQTLAQESDLSLSDLAERIQLGCSTVSGIVKRMVEAGMVERDRLDNDQRTVAIRLTEKGRELEGQAFGEESLLSRALGDFFALPQEHVDTLLKLNEQLIEALSVED